MKKLDKKLIKWFIGKNVFVDERIQKEVGIFATRTVFVLFVFEFVTFWIVHSLFYFNEGFFKILFSFKEIISTLFFTVFFTIFMALYERMHEKTVKDDE